MVELSPEDRQELLHLLENLPGIANEQSWRHLLEDAGLESFVQRINLSSVPASNAREIVTFLCRYGRIRPEHTALGLFLTEVRKHVGYDGQEFIDCVLRDYCMVEITLDSVDRLDELDVDIQSIDQSIQSIDSKLRTLEYVRREDGLSEKQEKDFSSLKLSLSKLDLELQNVSEKATNLLKRKLQDLEKQLQEQLEEAEKINLSKQELIEVDSQLICNSKIESIKTKIEIVQQFEADLEVGREVANWINKNITQLSKVTSKYALNQFPEIQSSSSLRKIDDFEFSVKQFLEQISHCLYWVKPNILDSPEIPLVLDKDLYKCAFNYTLKMIPSRFSPDVFKQVEYYIKYLIQRIDIVDF